MPTPAPARASARRVAERECAEACAQTSASTANANAIRMVDDLGDDAHKRTRNHISTGLTSGDVKCSICTQTHRETKKANQPYRASQFILWDAFVHTCCTRQFEHQRDGTEAMRPRIIDWLCCVFWPTAIPYRLLNVPHRDQNCVANSALRHVLQWIRRMTVHFCSHDGFHCEFHEMHLILSESMHAAYAG